MTDNSGITPQQAEIQFAAEEFASQVSSLTQRIAKHRVYEAQLTQELDRLRAENAVLREAAEETETDPADDESSPESH